MQGRAGRGFGETTSLELFARRLKRRGAESIGACFAVLLSEARLRLPYTTPHQPRARMLHALLKLFSSGIADQQVFLLQ